MQYTNLGRTALEVSRLCLGTMNFGGWTTEEDSFAIMDQSLELGFNFFDTANVYGGKAGKGATETIVGNWFAQGGGRREQVVLATKVYGSMGEGRNDGKLSARHIIQACNDSLRRLQTDFIDLYQMHHVWRHAPWDEIWQAFDTLISQGKVLYVGSSNFAAWNIMQANEEARKRHMLGLVCEQSLYNLNARTIELEVIPACRDQGVGLIPWSPLAAGLLGGIVDEAPDGRRGLPRVRQRLEEHRATFVAYEGVCRDLGEKPADVALAWLLHNDVVTAPIIGPRTMEQLESSMRALEIELSEETLKRFDTIFPGPGGQAPEAYAW
ncbi:MAG: aldo/keto reductase [Planctomycetota bacterium]|nr:aldo/keto reductase [Planctomycetota bacterium]